MHILFNFFLIKSNRAKRLLSANDEPELIDCIKMVGWADKCGIYVDMHPNNDLSLNLINLKMR